MNITMIGTGYVGLVSGTCFAEKGNRVVCVDKLEDKIAALKRGEIPIYEPGLKELVERNVREGRLFFTTDVAECLNESDVVFIAVGTPAKDDGSADMTYIYRVAEEIGSVIDHRYKVIVTKSTVPVGTAEKLKTMIQEKNQSAQIDVCSVPEFLREGSAVYDTFHPDRVVIGCDSKRAEETLVELHRAFTDKIVLTDIRSAEMIKYASNAFLATKISFINEIANICDGNGADVAAVAKGVGLDHRIGPKFLQAGIGYGGSCFPKDVRALIHMARTANYEPELLQAVENVNERQGRRVIDHLNEIFSNELKGLTIALLGLTFKPNTDDMREAPSLKIIRELREKGAAIQAYDPIIHYKNELPGITAEVDLCYSVEEAITSADAAVVITDWDEFKQLTPTQFKKALKRPVVIDGRNIFDPKAMKNEGLIYHGIGRRSPNLEDGRTKKDG